jgi:hypothetical protein
MRLAQETVGMETAPATALAEGSGRHQAERRRAEREGELVLSIRVTDPEVLAELGRRAAGAERDGYAAAALRVGVLALRSAGGTVDADAVRQAGDRLIGELRETLAERARNLTGELGVALTQYFDPRTGLLSQKLEHLVKDGGQIDTVLDRVLHAHVGDESVLARTLAAHVGEGSALFKMLSPDQANGLKAQVEGALAAALRAQSAEVLRQFSLDHKDSALSRLIAEVKDSQGALSRDLKAQVDVAARELSLDHEQSALSRLVRTVTAAVEGMAKSNGEFQSDVRATLAALDARKEEAGRSTRHGAEFEDALGQLLAAEAQRLGDVHQAVGATTGAIRNNKVGDHVVVMGRDSAAPGAVLVFEAKENKACDLRSALAEIEQARKNRQAQIGLFVFSARTAPPGLEPLVRYGDDIVVVWDAEDEATDLRLRCAYSMARGLASRVASACAASDEALREIELATRAIEKQLSFLEDVARMAGTVESNGKKIKERMDRMREQLGGDVERLDDQVRALRAAD